MKSYIPIDENIKRETNLDDFLKNIDNDINSGIDLDYIQENEQEKNDKVVQESNNIVAITDENIEEPEEECTALVVTKPNSLFVAQKMFKKSIKISIKSFLISLSLGFLNLFI